MDPESRRSSAFHKRNYSQSPPLENNEEEEQMPRMRSSAIGDRQDINPNASPEQQTLNSLMKFILDSQEKLRKINVPEERREEEMLKIIEQSPLLKNSQLFTPERRRNNNPEESDDTEIMKKMRSTMVP